MKVHCTLCQVDKIFFFAIRQEVIKTEVNCPYYNHYCSKCINLSCLMQVHLSEVRSARLFLGLGSASLVLTLAGRYQEHKRIDCGDSDDANVNAVLEVTIERAVLTYQCLRKDSGL